MRIKYDVIITYFHTDIEIIQIYNNIRNNKLNGEYKDWYSNGNLLEHSFYKDDKRDGEYLTYLVSGNMYQHHIYEDGKIIKDMRT